jgi:hypothetical protein
MTAMSRRARRTGMAAAAGAGCALATVALVVACGSSASAPTEPVAAPSTSGYYVAFASNFTGYRSWSSIVVYDDAGRGDPAHVDTPLIEYINQPAPTPPAPFPVGTIIVKEAQVGDPGTRQAFAMAKRGGDYNEGGAPGWEWFEIENVDDGGAVEILWRGVAPAAGELYAGSVNGDCNTCHVNAPHDGVYAE